jgi:hypothetical protein
MYCFLPYLLRKFLSLPLSLFLPSFLPVILRIELPLPLAPHFCLYFIFEIESHYLCPDGLRTHDLLASASAIIGLMYMHHHVHQEISYYILCSLQYCAY